MFLDPRLADAKPLMVVGAPRCGTRLVTQMLNTHPGVLLRGEMAIPAAESMVRFIEEVGRYYGRLASTPVDADVPAWRKPDRAGSWQRDRHELMYALWSVLLKGPAKPLDRDVEWFGHKTPRHDRYWRFYREFFREELRPRYVFCMREFTDHYRSVSAMTGEPIDVIAGLYRESVDRYAEMKAALGSDVSLFLLDDFKLEGLAYARRALFTDLGIEPNDESLERVDPSRKVNTLKGSGPRERLTREEAKFLRRNPDLSDAPNALRDGRPLSPAPTA